MNLELIAILVALALGFMGIFQDRIRAFFLKPKLNISIETNPPYGHKVPISKPRLGIIGEGYFFRFMVENKGRTKMENVEAIATSLYQRGLFEYEKVEKFLPLNLGWSHYHNPDFPTLLLETMPVIHPHLFKFCCLGHIVKSETINLDYYGIEKTSAVIFELDTVIKPNSGPHLLVPGSYKIEIKIAANIIKPKTVIFDFDIQDEWTDEDKIMFQKNISIKKVKSI